MPIRVGINGFGRIGRLTYRAIYEKYGLNGDVQVVALNDLTDAKTNAHLLEFDSNYGPFKGTVGYDGNDIVVDGRKVKVFAEKDPGSIPWGKEDVQIVVESTGFFTDATKAVAHKRDSVKKVVISAPAKNEDLTIVLGVNNEMYEPKKHHVISNASCTTNGLAPVAKVLHETWGIERGLLTTVHAYTSSQKTVDTAAKDLRDARAAALNIVPSSTGAARGIGSLPRVALHHRRGDRGVGLEGHAVSAGHMDDHADVITGRRRCRPAEWEVHAAKPGRAAEMGGCLLRGDGPRRERRRGRGGVKDGD